MPLSGRAPHRRDLQTPYPTPQRHARRGMVAEYNQNASQIVQRLSGAGLVDKVGPALQPVLEGAAMSDFLSIYLVPAAIVAVAIVLLLGLVNMMRGGSPDRSQKLMRLRVLLQFVAIVVIMATIWAMGR